MSEVARQSGPGDEPVAPLARAVPATMMRPTPVRVPELAHMDLTRLRAYRRALVEEEMRTSYWRRLIQARRDLLRADTAPGDRAALVALMTEERSATARSGIISLHPDGGMPILPHLPELWASGSAQHDGTDDPDDPDDSAAASLFARMSSAESVLSSYREALHKRLDRATADLVARYHEDPRQCLSAIPSPRARRPSVG